MKPPNQKKATIGEMVTWASQANGTIKRGVKYHLINAILMDIENLQALACVPWVSRKWALPAWREIQKIGILDGLELLPMQAPRPPDDPRFSIARIRQLCGLLGLGFNKINNRIVITRKTYTEKPKTKCQADL
jgi:hypothetical protein